MVYEAPLVTDTTIGILFDDFEISLQTILAVGAEPEGIFALPESYREAFVQHRFNNKSYKDIATEMGVSQKTVEYRISQAIKILRVELKDFLPLLILLFGDPRTWN